MKTIATIAASIALSVGVLAVPAHADEPVPAACAESQGREVLLGYQIDGLKKVIEVMHTDLVQAERKIEHKDKVIARLRAKLAKR